MDRRSAPFPQWLKDWLPEIALLLITTGAGIWAAGRWVNPGGDPSYAWSLGYRLGSGERLYRDIYVPHTPLSPYLLGAWARLFGSSARAVLFVNWIPAILAGLLLVRCGRFFLSTLERLALVGVVLATSLFAPGPGHLIYPYNSAVVHALALSVGALLLIRPDAERWQERAVLAGCLAGLAFCCRQEIGLACLVALVTPILFLGNRRLSWLTRLFAGFFAILLPLAVFVLLSAPVESLQRDNHLWPLAPVLPPPILFFYRSKLALNPGWARAAMATVFVDLLRAAPLALFALLLAREHRRSIWLRLLALVIGLGFWWLLDGPALSHPLPSLALSMSTAFLVAILALLLPDTRGRVFLVAFGTFAGLVAARTAFSTGASGHYEGPNHYATALTSVLFVLVLLPRLLLADTRAASYLRALIGLAVLAVSGWLTWKGVANLRYPDSVAVETRERPVWTTPAKAELFRAIARQSRAGERVLLVPESYAIDALFQLRSVSPLIQAIPGWLDEDAERQLIPRLEQSPPDLIVLLERPVAEFGSKPFGVGYGLMLADWCQRNYQVVESLPAGQILRRR
jgi:hypothetical protein